MLQARRSSPQGSKPRSCRSAVTRKRVLEMIKIMGREFLRKRRQVDGLSHRPTFLAPAYIALMAIPLSLMAAALHIKPSWSLTESKANDAPYNEQDQQV